MRIQVAIILCIFSGGLTGCGVSDTTDKFIPFVLRSKDTYQPPIDPEPDVAQLVRSDPKSVFIGEPTDLKVSKPRRNGAHWEACASAMTADVGGHASETVVAFPIEAGRIGARYRVPTGHWCITEPRNPV